VVADSNDVIHSGSTKSFVQYMLLVSGAERRHVWLYARCTALKVRVGLM
jgi:hypothetical protein